MSPQAPAGPAAGMRRLRDAQNRHDLEAFVACFAKDYRSEPPAHRARAFRSREQVRANWARMFDGVPDFRAELVAVTAAGETAWAEWDWSGRHADGTPCRRRGVTLFGVRAGQIVWGRLYMEPVEEGGADIEATVRRTTERA